MKKQNLAIHLTNSTWLTGPSFKTNFIFYPTSEDSIFKIFTEQLTVNILVELHLSPANKDSETNTPIKQIQKKNMIFLDKQPNKVYTNIIFNRPCSVLGEPAYCA